MRRRHERYKADFLFFGSREPTYETFREFDKDFGKFIKKYGEMKTWGNIRLVIAIHKGAIEYILDFSMDGKNYFETFEFFMPDSISEELIEEMYKFVSKIRSGNEGGGDLKPRVKAGKRLDANIPAQDSLDVHEFFTDLIEDFYDDLDIGSQFRKDSRLGGTIKDRANHRDVEYLLSENLGSTIEIHSSIYAGETDYEIFVGDGEIALLGIPLEVDDIPGLMERRNSRPIRVRGADVAAEVELDKYSLQTLAFMAKEAQEVNVHD